MKVLSILIRVVLLLTSCNNKYKANKILIEGNVKHIPDGKVYLTEAHHWSIFLDSTIASNGHFTFKVKADSSFFPYMASICFPDSTSPTKIRQLLYANEFLLPKGLTKGIYNHNSGFYLERGLTQINDESTNQNSLDPYVKIKAGRQNEAYYKNEGSGNLRRRIKEYPFSYFLLQSLFDIKEKYSKNEIREIISMFDKDLQNSKLGDLFRRYLAYRPDSGNPCVNLLLLNSHNERRTIIDTSSRLNMLVFWASWCGPCRMEIPTLKEIQKEYNGKGVNLVSISIDENKNMWEKALQKEKMVWPQYIVDKDKIDIVKQQYNFSAIPLVVFTDSKGIEIRRFVGFDPNQKGLYREVMDKVLSHTF